MLGIKSKVSVLSDSEIEYIHKSSCTILEKTGMYVPNREVCKLAESLGAVVDFEKQIVKIPTTVIDDLLKIVKDEKRNPFFKKKDEILTPLSGNISTQIFLVDYLTKTRRYGLMDDILKGISLTAGLSNIPNANAVVVPSDVPYEISDVLSFQQIYKYSNKPGSTYILTPKSAEHIIAMSKLLDREVSYLFDTISPLSFSTNTLDIALIFKEYDLTLNMTPMVMAGSTGPVTIAGTVALQNAEVLGSLFFIYAITGKIAKYVASGHTSDIEHNMLCSFGSPNQALLGVATAQMADFYGLKSGSNSGLTDSIYPDFQCGLEKSLTAVFSCLAGTDAIGGQGLVGSDQGFSMAQLVLDNEWINSYNHVIKGFEVSEDTIGLETIEEVGIGGNFLAEFHTAEYMRDTNFHSDIFDRDSFDMLNNRKHDILIKAENKAKEIIAQNAITEPVVSAKIAEEIDYIAEQAKK